MQDFSFNESLLIWINQDWANPAFDLLFEWLSSKLEFSIPLLIIIILYLGIRFGKKGWLAALCVIVVTALSDTLGDILKDIFQHARPCLDMYEFIRYPNGGNTQCMSSISGMPSNHAMNFFATFSFICILFPKPRIILPALTIAILVGISRVYLGEHYPSQVFVGALFGSLLGVSFALSVKKKLNLHHEN